MKIWNFVLDIWWEHWSYIQCKMNEGRMFSQFLFQINYELCWRFVVYDFAHTYMISNIKFKLQEIFYSKHYKKIQYGNYPIPLFLKYLHYKNQLILSRKLFKTLLDDQTGIMLFLSFPQRSIFSIYDTVSHYL